MLLQLMGLSALEGSELLADPTRTMAYQMSAMKSAFEAATDLIVDPAVVPESAQKLLEPALAEHMHKAVRSLNAQGGIPGHGGTACVLAADKIWKHDLHCPEYLQCLWQHVSRARNRHPVQ